MKANNPSHPHELPGFSKPVPTKFREQEKLILSDARRATDFSNSELIRRAVRLMGRQHAAANRYDFLLELTPT